MRGISTPRTKTCPWVPRTWGTRDFTLSMNIACWDSWYPTHSQNARKDGAPSICGIPPLPQKQKRSKDGARSNCGIPPMPQKQERSMDGAPSICGIPPMPQKQKRGKDGARSNCGIPPMPQKQERSMDGAPNICAATFFQKENILTSRPPWLALLCGARDGPTRLRRCPADRGPAWGGRRCTWSRGRGWGR